MVNHTKNFLGLLALVAWAEAYWRMSCSIIQTGRVDPIIAPGTVSAHVHKLSGASNIDVDSTFDSLQASRCTSCEVQDDKSAYWTPQLFYQHANGSFEMVPNGGTVIYYLGRGENRSNIEPFPPGFKMLSGDNFVRSYDSKTMTYGNSSFKGRPVADRVSFACLDSSGPSKERNYMWRTNCDNGMRAQIHFQSCWNGQDYQPDQSHVAYMSQIDNGVCPPTHPRQLPHLFFEVIYGVNNIDKSKGGRFVFANGDTTGYAFHGDFLNGWNPTVLSSAIKNCINNDTIGGAISKCPVLAASQTPYFSDNCPEMPPLINETIRGMIDALPGCIQPFSGPGRASPPVCNAKPAINDLGDAGIGSMYIPSIGDTIGSWSFIGCALEGRQRTLNKYAVANSNMSIEYCTASCKAQGYPLAGMENGRECYCAGSLTSGASYTNASTCGSTRKMACAGNMTQYCGGPNFLTIWNDTSYTPPAQLIVNQTQISQGMATYYGCWAEGTTGRALSSDSTGDTIGMTNEMCVAYCQEGGYTFAGTEYSQECYCGNSITNGGYNTTDISQCSMQCRGNKFSYCGAGGRLSVWKIKQPDQPTGPITALNGSALYTGCYTDGGPGGRTLPAAVFTGSAVSLDTCFSFCSKLNYPLFGMEYGRECYCGYSPKTQATIAPDGDCRMPCAGNSTQKCGAGNRISIWNNTLYTPTFSLMAVNIESPPKYLGCYTEGKEGRALGDAKTTDKKMSLDVCSSFCSSKGYPFLGLENGQDCYCSKKGPSNGSLEAPSSQCNVACKGDKSQKCGATNRLNVYRLARVSKNSSSSKTTSQPVAVNMQGLKTTSKHTTSHSKTTLSTATTRAPSKAKTKAANAKVKATTTTKLQQSPKIKATTSPKAEATVKAKTTPQSKPKTTSKTRSTSAPTSSVRKTVRTSTTSAKKTTPTPVIVKAKVKATLSTTSSLPKTTKPLTTTEIATTTKGPNKKTGSVSTTTTTTPTSTLTKKTTSITTTSKGAVKAKKTSTSTTSRATMRVMRY